MPQRKCPPLPSRLSDCFRATVHGLVFGDRSSHVARLHEGDPLVLLSGPPIDTAPGVWVHVVGGDLVGHLPPEIETWLGPWIQHGGTATARVIRVSGREVPSWRRLLIEVNCMP